MLDIIAFCDASYDKISKKATACSIIMSDLMFHNYRVEVYENVDTGARAELLGIIQTIEYVRDMKDVNTVTVYCDSATTISLYRNILKTGRINKKVAYEKDWKRLLKISEGLKVFPESIQGHRREHNPNKVCDVLACNTLHIMI